jgi:hypothetical protein
VAVQVRVAVSPLQVVPALPPQPPVGGGQTQAALVPEPPHVRPDAAQLVSASCRHPFASAVQAIRVLLWQYVSTIGQFMGGVGHWQAPFGKVVLAQVSPVAHGFDDDWRQPFTFAHVTTSVPVASQ